ncbi:MAG: universal stress protein [Planctomycetota bacterium]|nr:MAG: universal stress protein [Planctomycetota bacterium]
MRPDRKSIRHSAGPGSRRRLRPGATRGTADRERGARLAGGQRVGRPEWTVQPDSSPRGDRRKTRKERSVLNDLPFTHIVVPLDFTTKNEAALEMARTLASRSGARISLVHVVETIEGDENDELTEFYQTLQQRAVEELAAAARRFANTGIDVEEFVLIGRRGLEILRFAAEHGADLLLLSARTPSTAGVQRIVGSLSYQLSALAPCTVLVVK